MKKYVLSINEFFSNVTEEEEEKKEKTPEEKEKEKEQDADELETDYEVYNINEDPKQLELYNEIIENIATKLGLKYEGPYSTQQDTVAKIGDKEPLNLDEWDAVYYKIYDESSDAEPLYIEGITGAESLEKYMKENGVHWPPFFIYRLEKSGAKQIYKADADEIELLSWVKKEFDEKPKTESVNEKLEPMDQVKKMLKKMDVYVKGATFDNGPELVIMQALKQVYGDYKSVAKFLKKNKDAEIYMRDISFYKKGGSRFIKGKLAINSETPHAIDGIEISS